MSTNDNIVANLRKISNFAFDEDGNLLPILKQKELQEDAKSWIGELANKPFIVATSTEQLNIPELKNRPLILTRGAIKHVWKNHAQDFTFNELVDVLKNIYNELKNNVLAFQEVKNPNKICFVLDKLSRNNNHLMSVVETNCDDWNININRITTVHGKDKLLNKIQKTIDANLHVYTNKRTGKWLAHSETDVFNSISARSATSIYLYNLYCKQNHINNQEQFSTKEDADDRNAVAAEIGGSSRDTISREER